MKYEEFAYLGGNESARMRVRALMCKKLALFIATLVIMCHLWSLGMEI